MVNNRFQWEKAPGFLASGLKEKHAEWVGSFRRVHTGRRHNSRVFGKASRSGGDGHWEDGLLGSPRGRGRPCHPHRHVGQEQGWSEGRGSRATRAEPALWFLWEDKVSRLRPGQFE